MEAAKTLRRPANWQAFEDLCKRLWGEEWKCPEIKKHGRSGQQQKGVDIYGIPSGEKEYFGIQCKTKDENLAVTLKESEILEEVEKAKGFIPPLKKLYIATTASRDAAIEQSVRILNQKNISASLFEVHIFFWEDIVEKIDENKATKEFYLNNQNYKSNKDVQVSFMNGSNEITAEPTFQKTIRLYKDPRGDIPTDPMYPFANSFDMLHRFSIPQPNPVITNHSLSEILLKITNTGNSPLENYKVTFSVQGDVTKLADDNKAGGFMLRSIHHYNNILLSKDAFTGTVNPRETTLVPADTLKCDPFYIKPMPRDGSAQIHWKLLSNDFQTQGILLVNFKPKIETRYATVLIRDKNSVPPSGKDVIMEDFKTDDDDND